MRRSLSDPTRPARGEARRCAPSRPGDARGFTLVELLIVIVILGILAVISIRGIDSYRQRSLDAAVQTDLRNAMVAQEAYYADNQAYTAFTVADGGSLEEPEFSASARVTISASLVGTNVRLEGTHASSPNRWCLNSAAGEIVKGSGC